jgi:hypothetical protein
VLHRPVESTRDCGRSVAVRQLALSAKSGPTHASPNAADQPRPRPEADIFLVIADRERPAYIPLTPKVNRGERMAREQRRTLATLKATNAS